MCLSWKDFLMTGHVQGCRDVGLEMVLWHLDLKTNISPQERHLEILKWEGAPTKKFAEMAMNSILNPDDIKKALEAFKAADSFDHKKFFEMIGLKNKSTADLNKAFHLMDADNSGFIEEEELKFVLKCFASNGRDLTEKETKAFLQAADKDGDGKIGAEGKTSRNQL
ncbi:hypothetical protein DNTS_025213 [Danionella cerebrum]|uniref:Parvalbumin n=1 Tax=Danionella cerebrum TaxID=2873325 RepID=A0A553Q4E0_9TELE|nr:hypothetical protein DNTS_025213 [Danionella translucida]